MIYRIFIVYGRDRAVNQFVQGVLEACGVEVVTWRKASAEASKQHNRVPTILDVVRQGMQMADEIFVLFTPDEYVSTKKLCRDIHDHEPFVLHQARPNVILELGMALVMSQNEKPNKKLTIVDASARIPTDIDGCIRILWTDDIIYDIYNRISVHYEDIKPLTDVEALKAQNPIKDQRNAKAFSRINEADGISIVINRRGSFRDFLCYFEKAESVSVAGAINRSLMRMITDEPKTCFNKKIRILLPSNCLVSKNFDLLEGHDGRELFNEILGRTKKFYQKKANDSVNLGNVELKFYSLYLSCSIYIFDDVLWLTPYGTVGANESPAFLVLESECPSAFRHFKCMFDKIWTEKADSKVFCKGTCESCEYRDCHGLCVNLRAVIG